jgi:hypothetical protein
MSRPLNRPAQRLRVLLPCAEAVAPVLRAHVTEVLHRAAGTLEANIALFLDLQGHWQPPPLSDYGHTFVKGELAFPVFDVALAQTHPELPFAVRIWLGQAVLQGSHPTVLLTQALAHEVGHAHQVEKRYKFYQMWRNYEHYFLSERGSHVKPWERPFDIEAELFARRVVRDFHPKAELTDLERRYADAGYDRVLAFEERGDFDLEEYFVQVVSPRADEFIAWQPHAHGSAVRENGWLWLLGVQLKRLPTPRPESTGTEQQA